MMKFGQSQVEIDSGTAAQQVYRLQESQSGTICSVCSGSGQEGGNERVVKGQQLGRPIGGMVISVGKSCSACDGAGRIS